MIQYTRGNLLDSKADALINTVNEVGVMGKGIALQFREAFPENSRAYVEEARAGRIRVGMVFAVRVSQLDGPRWIINFPTKKHWRNPSQIKWIREGLQDLKRTILELDIRSIALPPLGCGNGGLEWRRIRREIEEIFDELPEVIITVYQPTTEYYGPARRNHARNLTPARALIIELVRRYSVLGISCTILEIQKLAWFLSRFIASEALPDPLHLTYKASKYGPYADQLRHLLDGLDGSYLHCEKRLADASPFDAIWFDESRKAELATYLRSGQMEPYLPTLERTTALIDGFESPLGMELLGTVDWLISERGTTNEVHQIRAAIQDWPGGRSASMRKTSLFDDRLLELALHQLNASCLTPAP